MKTSTFLCASLIMVLPLVKPEECIKREVPHEHVEPYPEPEPVKKPEKAGVRYKPSLHISRGCHPYAAVDAKGGTSTGLEPTGKDDGHCKLSDRGSQVYARQKWFKKHYAIIVRVVLVTG